MVRLSNHVWWPERFAISANALASMHWRRAFAHMLRVPTHDIFTPSCHCEARSNRGLSITTLHYHHAQFAVASFVPHSQ